MSDTPRTDASVIEVDTEIEYVPAHFARQLERELSAWKQQAESYMLASKTLPACNSVKMGEYNMLRCCYPKGHAGEHNYVVENSK